MAIDPLSETLISLADAAKLCPARRGGKRPHVSCIYRWTTSGCRGIVLEFIQVGGTRCTSKEAIQRFFDRLTIQSQARGQSIPEPISSRTHRKAMKRAEAVLDKAGI